CAVNLLVEQKRLQRSRRSRRWPSGRRMSALAAKAPAKARVLIAADHLATRTGMRIALADAADCSEADDADAAVAAAIREKPDVCVVDFDPPGRAIRATGEIISK